MIKFQLIIYSGAIIMTMAEDLRRITRQVHDHNSESWAALESRDTRLALEEASKMVRAVINGQPFLRFGNVDIHQLPHAFNAPSLRDVLKSRADRGDTELQLVAYKDFIVGEKVLGKFSLYLWGHHGKFAGWMHSRREYCRAARDVGHEHIIGELDRFCRENLGLDTEIGPISDLYAGYHTGNGLIANKVLTVKWGL